MGTVLPVIPRPNPLDKPKTELKIATKP